MKQSMRKAFTLIELLVVIAIIAILAAILFPVFAQAREKARQTVTISNFKQIGLAVVMYVQDNDEFYPMGQYFVDGAQNAWGASAANPVVDWSDLVNPYIKSGTPQNIYDNPPGGNGFGYHLLAVGGSVYGSPSAVNPQQMEQFDVREDVFPDQYPLPPGTEGINSTNASGPVCPESVIQSPSSLIAMWETGMSGANSNEQGATVPMDAWNWYANWGFQSGQFEPAAQDCDYPKSAPVTTGAHGCVDYPRYRHNGVTECLFLDGHVHDFAKGQDYYASNIFQAGLCNVYWDGAKSFSGCPQTP